jgi:hypothetical protein
MDRTLAMLMVLKMKSRLCDIVEDGIKPLELSSLEYFVLISNSPSTASTTSTRTSHLLTILSTRTRTRTRTRTSHLLTILSTNHPS